MTSVLISEESSLTKGKSAAVDPRVGGQLGALAKPNEWVNNADHVKQPIIAVLLAAPKAMAFMPDGAERISQLKALLELHPTSITGLNDGLTVEMAESVASSSGEQMQSVVNVTRERSNPVFSFNDKYGKIVERTFRDYITYLLQDPDTDYPAIISEQAYIDADSPELLPDMVSCSMLFFEPNPSLTGIASAWLCVNMMPQGVTNEGSRVKGQAKELSTQEISWTALTQTGRSVNTLAKSYLDALNKQGYKSAGLPNAMNADTIADAISPNLRDDAVATSYSKSVEEVAQAVEDLDLT